MGAQQIQLMMNKGVGGVMSKAKTKIKEEGKKKIKEKVLEQLPTKEELIDKLISAACSPAAMKKMEKIYNKIHGLIEKLESILLKAKSKVDAIKAKIDKVKDKVLPKIQKIMIILAAIILVLKILVILAPLLLTMCGTGPTTMPPCIDKMCRILMKAASIIGVTGGTVDAVSSAIKKYMKIALTIIASIMAVILLINPLLAFVQRIKAFIEFLYLMYITMCTTYDTSVMDEDGNINESLLEAEILSKGEAMGFALDDDVDLGKTGLEGLEALKETGYGVGDASGIGNLNQGTDYGLGGPYPGLGHFGSTGIIATGATYGQHTGLGTNTIPKNELHGITDKLTSLYEDLIIELRGKGKMEIVEHLTALDFGFQTRYERKIVPIT